MASDLDIAIVGCGLIGLQLALGLERRGIRVKVYEQASELKEIGAGIGLTEPTTKSMGALDPRMAEVINKIGHRDQDMGFVDGYSPEDVRLRTREEFHDMVLPEVEGQVYAFCQRSSIMTELAKLVPEGVVEFGKRVDTIECPGEHERLVMKFIDGSEAQADAVIGCDGIKSRVRRAVLDSKDPAAVPHYAKESVYRCLLDMDKACSALGDKAYVPTKWVGNHTSTVTYPISDNKYLNVALFVRDENEWPREDTQVIQSGKEDVVKAYATHGPALRALCEVLPDKLTRWGLFDMYDHPLSTYAYGAVALAGDAAHGSTPHHGAGAAMGIEDALVLTTLLAQASDHLSLSGATLQKSKVIKDVFQVYDTIRRERSQWLVWSSRYQSVLDKGEIEGVERDPVKYIESTAERTAKVFDHDWRQTVQQSENMLRARLEVAAV